MPQKSHKQKMVELSVPTTYAKGVSDTASLKKSFSSSPIFTKTDPVTDEKLRNEYFGVTLAKETPDASSIFDAADLTFSKAPNLADVDVKKAGLATPFVPNPTSPGEGNGTDPSKKPDAPEEFIKHLNELGPSTPFVGGAYVGDDGAGGAGTQGVGAIPQTTSKTIASKTTLGSYMKGDGSSAG